MCFLNLDGLTICERSAQNQASAAGEEWMFTRTRLLPDPEPPGLPVRDPRETLPALTLSPQGIPEPLFSPPPNRTKYWYDGMARLTGERRVATD